MVRSTPTVVVLFAVLVAALLPCVACERERVEVAESDASSSGTSQSDAGFPIFAVVDAAPDVQLPTCGSPPVIGRCPPCPNGYVSLEDGGATCECCL